MKNTMMNANGVNIRVYGDVANEDAFICLTDIAKYRNSEFPALVVNHWIRNIATISYLGLWEQLNNSDFNLTEFGKFKISSGEPSFAISPTQWVEKTNAIGITTKAGRYGGTYAHSDIAFEFASAEELVVLINLEDTNADLIRQGVLQIDRSKILREKAYRQLKSLLENQKNMDNLKTQLIEQNK